MINEFISKIKNLEKKKKILIGLAAFILVLFILILLFPSRTSQVNNASNSTNNAPGGAGNFNNSDASLFVNQESMDKARESADKQYEKEGKPTPTLVQTKFEYIVDPALRRKKSFFPFSQVYAASSCDLDSAPAVVPIYILKTDWGIQAAKKVANSFGISGEPTSLPITGGYEYYFSNNNTGDFLTYIPASGMYTYHQVIKNRGARISGAEADAIIEREVKKHSLPDDISKTGSGFDNDSYLYHGFFRGNWSPFTVVDYESLSSLKNQSVCGKRAASTVNDIRIFLARDGQIAKVINQIRVGKQQIEVARENLEEAVVEYKYNLPVQPIIIGKTNGGILAGNVNITEATLAYYDFGDIYGQSMYMPMYVTSGEATLSNGARVRVITLFPAVSSKELERVGLKEPVEKSLKLGSFSPPPTPYPTATPKATSAPSATSAPTATSVPGQPTNTPGPTSPAPTIGPPATGCPGGLVDYFSRCDSNGTPVCSQFISVSTDPWGICTSGCQSKELILEVVDTNPCAANFWQYGFSAPGTQGQMTGTFHCVLNACPC